jgi:hypothetical protein
MTKTLLTLSSSDFAEYCREGLYEEPFDEDREGMSKEEYDAWGDAIDRMRQSAQEDSEQQHEHHGDAENDSEEMSDSSEDTLVPESPPTGIDNHPLAGPDFVRGRGGIRARGRGPGRGSVRGRGRGA